MYLELILFIFLLIMDLNDILCILIKEENNMFRIAEHKRGYFTPNMYNHSFSIIRCTACLCSL